MCYMLHTRCLRRVMWLPTLHMWLALGAKYLVFLKIVKNRGVFCEFCARIFMNACSILLSTSIFSWNRACHSRPCPWRTIWIECSHWSIFEFLACDFILHRAYSALDTLFFLFIIYSCSEACQSYHDWCKRCSSHWSGYELMCIQWDQFNPSAVSHGTTGYHIYAGWDDRGTTMAKLDL